MLKRLIFKQETALHLGLPALVWNVRIRLGGSQVCRECGGKDGLNDVMIQLNTSVLCCNRVCVGFGGKCFCQYVNTVEPRTANLTIKMAVKAAYFPDTFPNMNSTEKSSVDV